jgi:hypothetical protein
MGDSVICEGVKEEKMIKFDYGEYYRKIHPYIHKNSAEIKKIIKGYQVEGGSQF